MIEIVSAKRFQPEELIANSPFASICGANKTLAECLGLSRDSWTGLADGKIVCAWGLIASSLLSDRAYLWMIHTDAVEEHKFVFVRYSQLCMEQMLARWPTIIGHTKVDQPRSIRWLKWLGAVFGEPDGAFVPFQIKAR